MEQYSIYKITNAHAKHTTDEEATKLGCVGQLSVETEMREIEKKCEGVVVESVTEPVSQTVKFTGHMNQAHLEKMFGISSEGLKKGIKVYGRRSMPGKCTLTFDAFDLGKTDKLLLAFPNATVKSGFKLDIKNGETEVAEIDVEFKISMDDKEGFMYQAFESECESAFLKKWHTDFEPNDAYLVV